MGPLGKSAHREIGQEWYCKVYLKLLEVQFSPEHNQSVEIKQPSSALVHVLLVGLQSWMQPQLGCHSGAEGQNPLPPCCPWGGDSPGQFGVLALSALGHVELHHQHPQVLLILRAALNPSKWAKVFLYQDLLLSPLSLIFHSKFSLKGCPVTQASRGKCINCSI